MKKIIGVYRNQNMHWVGDGFPVKNLFSYDRLGQAISPFLLLDYAAPYHFTPTTQQHGVGSHPHRGFETVTIAYQGEVTHKDSAGGGGTIQTGDVQWMTAGAGILHQEYHEENFSKKGGLFQMVQMWVNLPAKDKETVPKYQDLLFGDMSKVQLAEDGGFVNVIAGEYKGQKGKGTTFSPIHLYNAYLKKGGTGEFTFPVDFNTAILVIEGGVKVNGNQVLTKDSFAMFENDKADTFTLEGTEDNTIVLIMSGEPLNEPVAHYGPFVMNTQEQLKQAFDDFQAGKFGQL